MTRLADTLDRPAPPDDLPPAAQALWWLAKGGFATGPDWERAHEIAQAHEGEQIYDAIHALAHRIEGDTRNAGYWDRRAGTDLGGQGHQAEWDALAARLG